MVVFELIDYSKMDFLDEYKLYRALYQKCESK